MDIPYLGKFNLMVSFIYINPIHEVVEALCQRLENEQKQKEIQTLYQEAIKFATAKHQEKGQKVKGTELP